MEYKIKIILGYREDQQISIPANEAHKAYYLFNHPNERGTFSNGYAVRGQDIHSIEPDYQGTMGWNATHELDEYDWIEIRKAGVDRKLRGILSSAVEAAKDPQKLTLPLSEIAELPQKAISDEVKALAESKRI